MLLRQSAVPAGLALGPKSDIRKDVKRPIGTVSSGIPWGSFSAATSTQPKRLKNPPILMALLARVVQSLKVVLGRVDGALV